ncbi:MAG: 50S ribosomal protein L11 methyltransferase [Deltaproteobacteria bacterium]|uniref:50S ribosomal protein L11 methyltransferase n=1 Tax=Candidatus Desulfacyla euxinica TaxID=2841693 RepID=A0A8J6N0D3_9DELT|nr:50S ribosomal protein L11 methyltransferase [Candidatus Desulfacyla euxinica]
MPDFSNGPKLRAEAKPPDPEWDYATWPMHRKMLADEIRCTHFREALLRVVPRGGTVLDVGAGTGILSIFAAQAGARKVYAVEETLMALEARELVARNGLADRIEILHSPIEELVPSEKVDVIVSEWLGGFAVDENMLPPVLLARDRWLKPGGAMIPNCVDVWMAPCFLPDFEEKRRFWLGKPYGVDMALVAERMCCEIFYEQHDLSREHLMSESAVLWTIDSLSETVDRSQKPFETKSIFIALRSGEINGLAAWFSADLGGGVLISTDPDSPANHWGRVFLPLTRPLMVQQGNTIEVNMACHPLGPLATRSKWTVMVKRIRSTA